MMVRSRLVVEVEDAVWQRQLFQLSSQILPRIAKVLGAGIVEELEFRIAPRIPRRPPQMAAAPAAVDAEAEGIRDPVMRAIYKRSRKKAIS